MANNYNAVQSKWIIRQHWKLGNVEHLRRAWQEAIHTPPHSRKAFYRIGDKFGQVCNAPNSGRPKTSMNEENEMLVAMIYEKSPKKSTIQNQR